MRKLYLLVIPIAIGIFTAAILSFYFLNFSTDLDSEKLLTVQKLTAGGSPVIGNPAADITILEWGDYQCTFCYRFHQSSLITIEDEFIKTGKVKLTFKDFPLNGPDSVLAAEATYCAGDQEKYWAYHDHLYENWAGERTGWISLRSLNGFAQDIGLDLNQFSQCLNSHKYQKKVLELEKFGKQIGIIATPSFLIFDDKKIIKITGNQPIEVFRKVIAEL